MLTITAGGLTLPNGTFHQSASITQSRMRKPRRKNSSITRNDDHQAEEADARKVESNAGEAAGGDWKGLNAGRVP